MGCVAMPQGTRERRFANGENRNWQEKRNPKFPPKDAALRGQGNDEELFVAQSDRGFDLGSARGAEETR